MPKLLSRKFTGFVGAAFFGLAIIAVAAPATAGVITNEYDGSYNVLFDYVEEVELDYTAMFSINDGRYVDGSWMWNPLSEFVIYPDVLNDPDTFFGTSTNLIFNATFLDCREEECPRDGIRVFADGMWGLINDEARELGYAIPSGSYTASLKVPEPASALLFLAGLLALAGIGWRRRRKQLDLAPA